MQRVDFIEPNYLKDLFTHGGEKLTLKIFDLFKEHFEIKLNDALAAKNEKDYSRLKQILHAMKSSSGAVGAIGLIEAIVNIENEIANSEFSDIGDHLDTLKSGFASTRSGIELLLNQMAGIDDDDQT